MTEIQGDTVLAAMTKSLRFVITTGTASERSELAAMLPDLLAQRDSQIAAAARAEGAEKARADLQAVTPASLRAEAGRRHERGYVHYATVRNDMRKLADHMEAMAEFGSGAALSGGERDE